MMVVRPIRTILEIFITFVKKNMKIKRLLTLTIFLIVGFFLSTTWAIKAESEANLTVSAAISLKSALEDVKNIYQTEKNNNINYNFGSSGSLQQQIEQGAPVDVFISAATKQMDALENKNLLLPNSRKNLLKNELVLITPQAISNVTSFEDLTKPEIEKIAIGEPQSVPAGQYAEEALTYYKVLEQVKSKLVFAKNVAQVLNFVQSGNADAGIVYITDAKTSDKVRVAAKASPESHSEIVYPMAIIKASNQIEPAQEYVNFLSGEQAKKVFKKYGFITPES